jgi:hypothetical protein
VPMRIRYSAERLALQANARRLTLAAIGHLQKHRPDADMLALESVRLHTDTLRRHLLQASWGKAPTSGEIPAPEETAEEAASSSTDEASSSSSSDSIGEEENAEGLTWMCPGSGKGKLHAMSGSSPLCPSRITSDYKSFPTLSEGKAMGYPLCARCALRLPRALQETARG